MAAAVLLVVFGGVAALMSTAFALSRDARHRVVAANLATHVMEETRATPFEELLAAVGQPVRVQEREVAGLAYSVARSLVIAPSLTNDEAGKACLPTSAARPALLKVTVAVTWADMGRVRPVLVESLLSPPDGTEFGPGGGHLAVRVLDAAGEAVGSGHQVTVSLHGQVPRSAPVQGGCAFFEALPGGTWKVQAMKLPTTTNILPDVLVTVTEGYLRALTVSFATGPQTDLRLEGQPSGGRLPPLTTVNLANPGLQPSGLLQVPSAEGMSDPLRLYPFESGYEAWAGLCPDADPGDGRRTAFASPTGGTTATVTIPLATVEVQVLKGSTQLIRTSGSVIARGSCGEAFDFGTPDADGTITVALPHGSWEFSIAGSSPEGGAWPTVSLELGQPAAYQVDVRVSCGGGGCAPAYRDVIRETPGLIGYWRLGEASGTTASDSSGARRHGTYVNGPVLGQPGLVAGTDTAAAFDGVDDHVALPSLDLAGRSFSVETWVRPSAGSPPPWQTVLGVHSGSGGHQSLHLALQANGSMRLDFNGDGVGTPAATVGFGETSHVVATYDAPSGTARLHVNGRLRAQGSAGPFSGTSPAVRIGRWHDGHAKPYRGILDDVAVFDRVLDLSTVLEHYREGGGTVPPSLDVTPDTSQAGTGEQVGLTATLDAPATVATAVRFEIESGPDDPDGDSPASPDMTCTVDAGATACGVQTTATSPGTQVVRAWVDADGNPATVEADPQEGRDSAAVPGLTGEPDSTDVVEVIYQPPPPPQGTLGPYPTKVLASNPIAFWRLGETTGLQARDISSYGLHGTYQGGPTLNQPALVDDTDGAARFDGSDDAVSLPPMDPQNSPFSIEAWIAPSLAPPAEQVIFSAHAGSGPSQTFRVVLSDTGGLRAVFGNGSVATAPGVVQFGHVHHVVVTCDPLGPSTKIFVDGTLRASQALGSFAGASPTVRIGRGDSPAQPFNGVLDEVAVYARALPQPEVRDHRDAGLGRYGAAVVVDNPVSFWRFGERSGTTAFDTAGSAPGSYSGGPTLGVAGAPAGSANGAARFDGADDGVSFGDIHDFPGQSPFSVEAWVKTSQNLPDDAWWPIVEKWQGPGPVRTGWGLRIAPPNAAQDRRIGFERWNSGSASAAWSVTQVQPGIWYHVVGTYDGATMRVYVNGTEEGSVPISGLPVADTAAPLLVAKGDGTYKGEIDELAVYDFALGSARISAHHAAGLP